MDGNAVEASIEKSMQASDEAGPDGQNADQQSLNERLKINSTLFTGVEQHENFNRYYKIFPSKAVSKPSASHTFEAGAPIQLPDEFQFSGRTLKTSDFLKETDTAALLVLKNGVLRHERYMLTGGQDVQWLSMSVAKSVISALVGIALNDGHIKSIDEPITDYVPQLTGSAYDGVRIKDVLQMSSGARWNENYSDRESEVLRFVRVFGRGDSINEFTGSLVREYDPGTVNRYNSADTQALGMLLVEATGRTITDYTREKLWEPMGAEYDAYWLCDNEGMEMAFGGFNAAARDYAKIGELFRQGGAFNGKQIVPADWVKASVTPDGAHVQPGRGTPGEFSMVGYGFQWWVPEGDAGEYSAVGVYNQFVYVNPKNETVIVKLSANRGYANTTGESSKRQLATFELFRAITAQLAE